MDTRPLDIVIKPLVEGIVVGGSRAGRNVTPTTPLLFLSKTRFVPAKLRGRKVVCGSADLETAVVAVVPLHVELVVCEMLHSCGDHVDDFAREFAYGILERSRALGAELKSVCGASG